MAKIYDKYSKTYMNFCDYCIFIDENIYELSDKLGYNPDEDPNVLRNNPASQDERWIRIVKYLEMICYMLAKKKGYFYKEPTKLKDFAFYCVGEFIQRIRNPKQDMYKEDGTPRMRKIKSCLNYLNKKLYFYKLFWQRLNYVEWSDAENIDMMVDYLPGSDFGDSYSLHNYLMAAQDIKTFPHILKKIINKSPYSDLVNHKLYITCLMYLINLVESGHSPCSYEEQEIAGIYIIKTIEVLKYG